MQQVTFLHSKNGTSVICDDAQASIFASWYNKHNAKDEKRDRFSVMCLLNRSEASRFAACTYGIMIAGKSVKQIFTASLSCALRSCIIDGFAKMPLPASIFASWYNIHKAAFGAAVESAGASPQPCGY